MGVYFRLLRPILFSISATLAFTDVGETSDTLPVVPLELLPPVSAGSSNITLSLSLALSSAVKVQVVILVNSRRSSSSFNSSLSRFFINSRVKFFQDGCIILSLVVEHVGVIT